MRSEPARLGEISLDFAEIPPRRDENFPYEHNIRTFVLHDGFMSLVKIF